MFAFYSLFVYIFYTLFNRSQEDEAVKAEDGATGIQDQGSVSMETKTRPRQPGHCFSVKDELWTELMEQESPSDSDGTSGSDDDWLLTDATSPLTEFLSLKQEAAGGTFSQADKEHLNGKVHHSPLLSVMSHLLSFLEHYSHMQRLQDKAAEYRARLRSEEAKSKKQRKVLRRVCKQELRDKLHLIENLQDIINEQETLLLKLQTKGSPCPEDSSCPTSSPCPEDSPCPTDSQCPEDSPCPTNSPFFGLPPSMGVQRLVESINTLQSERTKLVNEVQSIKMEVEHGENEKKQLLDHFEFQIHNLKEQIRQREEELTQLRIERGVTDSEKRIQHLSIENESLKQNLGVTQGLLQQLSTIPLQPSAQLLKENEDLRSKVHLLEGSLQQKLEQLLRLETQMSNVQWRKEEQVRQLEERMRGLQLELHRYQDRPAEIQYITQQVEVDSPATLKSLQECEQRNRQLLDQLSIQGEQFSKLEQQQRDSQQTSSELKFKIMVYEAEIQKLREDLLQKISQLEASKDEAVREASECSEEHLDQLRQQFTGVQHHLTTLKPVLKIMKANYNSLRSQVKNFSQFYEAAITEAKKQIQSAITEVSESNRNVMEKYEREMVLRKKYHDQLVELRGNIRVLCRVKPVSETDQTEGARTAVVSTDPAQDYRVRVMHKGKTRTFELDKVFPPQATQEEVFEEIEPFITSCIDGYNICIFAYGQTGSGKTYTMEGLAENPGINQRALRALFKETGERRGSWTYTISLSMLEIYNEHLRDLLGKEPHDKLEIKLNPDGSGQLHVPGLTHVEVKHYEEIGKVLSLGWRNRVTQSTNMNQHSSRSHALLTVTVTGTDTRTNTRTAGKLNLVDLAGSERVWKSEAEGERLKEAQNINRSLLALGDVIQALRAKQNHVPFRNSKLTYLLQDSLGKGNKTVMLVQVSPLAKDSGESMCSLKFAQRVCKVEQGPASQRLVPSGTEFLP
ncbi:kinesin-like protein KIFC3 isoform X2 [Heterodontus francisci]|uniref:kinesin-like protein KIFC3 isoform X2 n=1 Tax=Heterodontus francisci TaxID=7792 RepID=UPI00355B584E